VLISIPAGFLPVDFQPELSPLSSYLRIFAVDEANAGLEEVTATLKIYRRVNMRDSFLLLRGNVFYFLLINCLA